MKLLYKGKTKDVYEIDNESCLLKFKDDVTGENGVFDPGANTVGLTMEGAGEAGLKLTTFFFERINELGIPTHYIESNLEDKTMKVKKATAFGNGVEVICRYKAVGSFMRRFGMYAKEGQDLDAYVEITLKDDERNDPPIDKVALEMLGILSKDEYEILVDLTKKISNIIKDELSKKGLDLYDIKLEFGRVGKDGHIALIDEISGGNMRAYKGSEKIDPLDLVKIIVG